MAAALVSCGTAIASLLDDRPEPVDDHYATLCEAPADSAITVLVGDKLRSGWIEGPSLVMGEECIGYVQRRTHGNERRYVFKNRCMDIQLMPPGTEPFATAKRPFECSTTPEALESIGAGAAAAAATKYECAAVVFSTVSRLEEELDEPFDLSSVGPVPLVDVVRPQRFLSSGVPYRTHLVPSSSDSLPDHAEAHPPVAIFDGSQGYLRLRHCVDAISSVLLLDRWDPNAWDAAVAFMAENAGCSQNLEVSGIYPVPGMEMLAFEDRR